MKVRLAVAGERGVVLDKTLVVTGDRALPGDAPAPFAKMRIGYERTAGGPNDPVNPIGVGFTGGLPNILHADPARAFEPAGFGPLAAAWPVRRALLRRHEIPAFDSGPVTLPDDLDWSYFQAAPLDQRLPELPERAWILLEGLHAEHPSLRMHLPHLLGTARLYSRSHGEATLALRADTVLIDGEAQRCARHVARHRRAPERRARSRISWWRRPASTRRGRRSPGRSCPPRRCRRERRPRLHPTASWRR